MPNPTEQFFTQKRPDPIPCPICGADIDPNLLYNEEAIFGTEFQKMLNAIPQWGCFAIPGWTHSTWEWPEGAEIARSMYLEFTRPTGATIELLGVQHAWKHLRTTIKPSYSEYAWVPQRLREVTLSAVTR